MPIYFHVGCQIPPASRSKLYTKPPSLDRKALSPAKPNQLGALVPIWTTYSTRPKPEAWCHQGGTERPSHQVATSGSNLITAHPGRGSFLISRHVQGWCKGAERPGGTKVRVSWFKIWELGGSEARPGMTSTFFCCVFVSSGLSENEK